MDIDSEDSGRDELQSSGVAERSENISHGFASAETQLYPGTLSRSPQRPASEVPNYSEQKWTLLQSSYRDAYTELFQAEIAEQSLGRGTSASDLEQSQIGAVIWHPSEKEKLYRAVSRNGIRDLLVLAGAVGSKSQPEIQDFLLLLREKEAERHLLFRHTKTISHAEIPAAIEISAETEAALESAADAQLAYEDHYEHAYGTEKNAGLWLIDAEVAEQLDADQDQVEELLGGQDEETGEKSFETPIFYISTFIELSTRFFMNNGLASSHGDWTQVAVDDETPALTKEVVSDLYDLAVHLTRKLVQTSLFLAQSRQRATTRNHYRHASTVRDQDVTAAVSVLNLKDDLWQFWLGMARRNKLNVVENKKKNGKTVENSVPYDLVEQILSKRRAKWRGRRRGSSAATDTSLTEDEALDTADQMSLDEDAQSISSADQNPDSSSDDEDNIPEAHPLDEFLDGPSLIEAANDSSRHPSPTESSSESSDGFSSLSIHTATPRRQYRHMQLEDRHDTYLEHLDAEESHREEAFLQGMLGLAPPLNVKPKIEEDTAPSIRPKMSRKSMGDLTDPLASTKYGAEWELFGAVVPNDAFVETERARKRARTVRRERSPVVDATPSELPLRPRTLSTSTGDALQVESTDDEPRNLAGL